MRQPSSPMPNRTCPSCGELIDGATCISRDRPALPGLGDHCICIYCDIILEVGGKLQFEIVDVDGLLDADPAKYLHLMGWRNSLKKAKKRRNKSRKR